MQSETGEQPLPERRGWAIHSLWRGPSRSTALAGELAKVAISSPPLSLHFLRAHAVGSPYKSYERREG